MALSRTGTTVAGLKNFFHSRILAMHRKMTFRASALAALLASGVVGCSHTEPANEQLGISRTSIEAAQSAGANDSSPEMAMAREKLAQADAASRANDTVKARRLAEQAEVDALVARSKTSADKSRKVAAELDASLATLREEMTRGSNVTTTPVRP
jgi:triphosphoribosyl-dephospho-CoA synthetase